MPPFLRGLPRHSFGETCLDTGVIFPQVPSKGDVGNVSQGAPRLWSVGNVGASTLRDVPVCNIELNFSNAIAHYPSNLAFCAHPTLP